MSDADDLDAASDLVDSGPAATQQRSTGSYQPQPIARVEVPEKPQAKMSGVPPEQWARPVTRN